MKLAIVFDDLIQFGGAEKLLLTVTEIWPEAPVYTSTASGKWKKICRDRGIDLRTSFLQKFPLREKLNRVYAPLFLYVYAFESFDLTEYDIVLSISARFAHGVITRPHTKHVCYMNSPGRMIWEPHDYFRYEKRGEFLKGVLGVPLSILRLWDVTAANRVDTFIANSKTPQKRIKKYYGYESDVIYPPLDLSDLVNVDQKADEGFINNIKKQKPYFLVLTRLVPWKRVDIAIDACNELGLNLKIAGTGPDHDRLKKMAAEKTEFLGYVDGAQKKHLIENSMALINTQFEDFGLSPLEAMVMGKPVVAFGKGGVLETIIPGITGEFFYEQNAGALKKVLKSFDPQMYDPNVCAKQAQKFNKRMFVQQLVKKISSIYSGSQP